MLQKIDELINMLKNTWVARQDLSTPIVQIQTRIYGESYGWNYMKDVNTY
jgi:hypothetical protein